MREDFRRWTTWKLATELAKCTRLAEKLRRSRLWSHALLRMVRDRRLRKIDQREDAVSRILEQRYNGVLHRSYFFITFETGDPDDAASFQGFEAEVWNLTIEEMDAKDAWCLFSSLLWRQLVSASQACGAANSLVSVERLKPMFMLRQFVDEMADSDARGVLRTWFYNGAEKDPTGEVLDALEAAYHELHKIILLHANELEQLTGGAITMDKLAGVSDPGPVYERWLLGR